jgi:uncharacterized membrane protein (UPF0127 family)
LYQVEKAFLLLGEIARMTRRSLFAALLAGSLLALPAAAQTGPQPDLPKEQLVIVTHDGARHIFRVEMALTQDQQVIGLMFRTSVPEDGGMLFINADGSIRSIAEHTVPQSLAVIDSRGPVRATLEVAAGTAERLDIRVGDKVLQRIFGNAP